MPRLDQKVLNIKIKCLCNKELLGIIIKHGHASQL
jgi:hypothetical protein